MERVSIAGSQHSFKVNLMSQLRINILFVNNRKLFEGDIHVGTQKGSSRSDRFMKKLMSTLMPLATLRFPPSTCVRRAYRAWMGGGFIWIEKYRSNIWTTYFRSLIDKRIRISYNFYTSDYSTTNEKFISLVFFSFSSVQHFFSFLDRRPSQILSKRRDSLHCIDENWI